jgi:hypothetical protein
MGVPSAETSPGVDDDDGNGEVVSMGIIIRSGALGAYRGGP